MAWICNQSNTLVMEITMVDIKPVDDERYILQAYGTQCLSERNGVVGLCEPMTWELVTTEFQRVKDWLVEGATDIYQVRSEDQIQSALNKDEELRAKWQDMY